MIPETKKRLFFFGMCNVSCHALVHNICRIQKLCQNIVNKRQSCGRKNHRNSQPVIISVKNRVSRPLAGGLTKGQLQLNRHVWLNPKISGLVCVCVGVGGQFRYLSLSADRERSYHSLISDRASGGLFFLLTSASSHRMDAALKLRCKPPFVSRP